MRQLIPGIRFRSRRAQALTEFAIVAPVMVTSLLFAMYFYEIIQVKLKSQEISRFAAWEFQSHALHDYQEGKTDGFGDAKSKIKNDLMKKYRNLKSGTDGSQDKAFAVGWGTPQVQMQDQIEPKIPGGSLVNQIANLLGFVVDIFTVQGYKKSIQNPVLLALMVGYHAEKYSWFGAGYNRFNPPSKWKFNTRGYPKVRVRLEYENLLINKKFMQSWFGPNHFLAKKHRFKQEAAVVSDSWRLNYGDNIEGKKHKDKAYYKQVDRMAFVTPAIKNGFRMYTTIIMAFTGIISSFAAHPPLTMDPRETALVSKAYSGQDPGSGKIEVKEDHDDGPKKYDTSPMTQPYQDALKVRGKHFMGCDEQETLGCFDSVSSDNPFGDYVLPPEQQ